MAKLSISMAIFNSYVSHSQRVPSLYRDESLNHHPVLPVLHQKKKACPGTPVDRLDHDERRNLWVTRFLAEKEGTFGSLKCMGIPGYPPTFGNLWIFVDIYDCLWGVMDGIYV